MIKLFSSLKKPISARPALDGKDGLILIFISLFLFIIIFSAVHEKRRERRFQKQIQMIAEDRRMLEENRKMIEESGRILDEILESQRRRQKEQKTPLRKQKKGG